MASSGTTHYDRSKLPKPSSDRIPANIILRPAVISDSEALATCFFTSFMPSHPFWTNEFKPDPFYPWWVEAWGMCIDHPSWVTFAAVDTAIGADNSPDNKALAPWEQKGANVPDGRIVAFARWRIPQKDGKNEELWPDLPEGLDMDVMGAFFGGMEEHHHEMMEDRPHWFIQMLGTEDGYQRKGIGKCFMEWGLRLADEEGLECYVDASPIGAPLYKSLGFVDARTVKIPDKESYGHFEYASYRRPKGGK